MKHKILPNMLAALLVLAALIFSTIVVVFAATLPVPDTKEEALKEFSVWQSHLKNDVLVCDVVMPGAHDAGTVGMANIMQTQSARVEKQLRYGVRYFDVRPMLYDGKLYPYHAMPNTFYPFEELLQEVLLFLIENSTEFVVLDFQHFSGAEEKTKELLDSMTQLTELAVPKTSNISTLTVGELRAKRQQLIIVWNEDYGAANRPYLQSRAEMLYSPYAGSAHQESDERLLAKLEDYYAEKPQGKLFVLQAQRTGAFGFEMDIFKLEQQFRPKINTFLDNLEIKYLSKTNIIMRDFVTLDTETMLKIINLNVKKQNFAK